MRVTRIIIIAAFLLCQNCLAQETRIIKLPQLKQLLSDKSSDIHIINFWATWCGPCVKELPYFDNVTAERKDDIKVTLVSLDLDLNPDPQKVNRFIKIKKIRSEVVMLDEADPNSWINQIDDRWSGALPATIIINNKTGKRIFIDRSLEEGQLEKYLDESKKQN